MIHLSESILDGTCKKPVLKVYKTIELSGKQTV